MASNEARGPAFNFQESVAVKDEAADRPVEGSIQAPEVKEVDCKTSLAEGFSRLLNEESTSDVTLVVGCKRYFAHKTVLSASSEYFYHMFYGAQWRESVQDEPIVLHETPACQAVFDTFIRYFYTGVVNFSPQIAPDLLTLADKYDAKVKQNCQEYMIETINKGNIDRALAWISICNRLKALEVLERCFVIICFNLEKAAEMSGWLSLSLQDILIILQRDDIVVPSEYNIYVAFQTWILSQIECPLETIEELLSYVKFKCLRSFELVQVETSSLATAIASESTKQHLYEAFRYLAVSDESQKLKEPKSNRTYTKNKVQKVVFINRSASIIPRCPVYTKAKYYTWLIRYTQTDDSGVFSLHLPSTTREVTEDFVFSNSSLGRKPQIRQKTSTCSIQDEIPGIVRVKVKALLRNTEGVVNYVSGKSIDITLPTYSFTFGSAGGSVGKDIVDLSFVGLKSVPDECFVSFEISKID